MSDIKPSELGRRSRDDERQLEPGYFLIFDISAAALIVCNAFLVNLPCSGETCRVIFSYLQHVVITHKYERALIDYGYDILEANRINLFINVGFCIAIGFFFARLSLEAVRKETLLSKRSLGTKAFFGGAFLLSIVVFLNFSDSRNVVDLTIRHSMFSNIALVTFFALGAAGLFEKCIAQTLAFYR